MVRVFITYSHDSDAHRARVLGLADRMRRDGLDVRLDQYEVHVPEGWLMWMRRQLENADFVAVICTATYRRRFEGEESASDAHAATWEGALTQQILYDAGTASDPEHLAYEKMLPIPVRTFLYGGRRRAS